ncbi:hypothetical protein R1sor_017330 [Riccia sorocarpa]|uniref:Uncharacterized protein n=1 Tax=Riccia sorocarpa TaxID=122646 RepID=A0ABD3I6X7_9MARC
MKELKHTLIEERYYDAASLHKGGAGLLGRWVGTAESEGTVSYGHIIHISAAHGRFIAKSHNANAPERLQPNTPDIGLKHAETDDDHDGSSRAIDKVSQRPTIDNTVRGESNNMEKQESDESSVKLLITGAMQNSIDDKDITAPMRIPAQLERKTKDSFTFSFRAWLLEINDRSIRSDLWSSSAEC